MNSPLVADIFMQSRDLPLSIKGSIAFTRKSARSREANANAIYQDVDDDEKVACPSNDCAQTASWCWGCNIFPSATLSFWKLMETIVGLVGTHLQSMISFVVKTQWLGMYEETSYHGLASKC